MPFHKILVPVDFSDSEGESLDLARTLEAEVDVLHVIDLPGYLEGQIHVRKADGTTEALEPVVLRHVAKTLDALLSSRPPGVRLSPRIEIGRPAERIVDVATQGGFDLVVLGTRGPRARARLLGGVAEKVVRRAPCPVLVLPVSEPPPVEPITVPVHVTAFPAY